MKVIITGALAVLAAAHSSHAQPATKGVRDYAACLALARSDPDKALARAHTLWRSGAGPASRHCVALALMAKGRHMEAAKTLEQLAKQGKGAAIKLKGEILGQAGQAWMMAGEGKRAIAAFTGAIALKPGDAELLIDRAIAYGNEGRYGEAVGDLNRVLDKDQGRANAYLLRANAYRRLGRLGRAARDVGRALALKPDDGEALLERGIIRHLQNDTDAARRDWTHVLRAAPASPAAAVAQRNLQMLGPQGK
ncbi:MAG: tetratricopeptide repeat protein [Alphaproteobacteria bacterium]